MERYSTFTRAGTLETDEAKALEAIEGAREKVQRMYAEAFADANESIMQDEAAETKKAADGGVKLMATVDAYLHCDSY